MEKFIILNECPHKTAMDSWEYFLINKYHPKYNKSLNESININIQEPEWKLYMSNNKIISISEYLKPASQGTNTTKIIYDPYQHPKRFRCSHCGAIFETTSWYKTKTKFGARCPCCPYTGYST